MHLIPKLEQILISMSTGYPTSTWVLAGGWVDIHPPTLRQRKTLPPALPPKGDYRGRQPANDKSQQHYRFLGVATTDEINRRSPPSGTNLPRKAGKQLHDSRIFAGRRKRSRIGINPSKPPVSVQPLRSLHSVIVITHPNDVTSGEIRHRALVTPVVMRVATKGINYTVSESPVISSSPSSSIPMCSNGK